MVAKRAGAVATTTRGLIEEEQHWSRGLLEGPARKWNDAGVLVEEGQYHESDRAGRWREWDDTGVLVFEGDYLDGDRHGLHRHYWPDGSPRLEVGYFEDLRSGPQKIWNRAGTLILEAKLRRRRVRGRLQVLSPGRLARATRA